jgi:agmatinase
VVLGVPADDKSSFMRGAAKAPGAIREALATSSWNLFAEDGLDLGACERLKDAGDLALGGRLDLGAVEGAAATLLSRGARLVGLGGDHSVSLPLLRAQAAAGGPLAVLHFDAHPDLYEAFEGDRFSHACPFARALEEGLLTRLVQVGIRGMNAHQRAQARRYGVEVIDMAAFAAGERPAFDGPFYLSFDIDALDPAFAPGVSHREPGGLSTREAISLIATTSGKLVGADLVELNPSRDWEGLTALTAAKLLKELLARMVRDSE